MLFSYNLSLFNISFIQNGIVPNVIQCRVFATDTSDSYAPNVSGPARAALTVDNELNIAEANKDSMDIIPLTYSEICNLGNLEKGLARTKSGKSAGLDGEVKATWTQSKLEKLASELRSHKFQASPIKKVWIPKPDGGKRPLGISSQKDKIVQATILERLEKETEKVFLDCSYGFRPKRGCHDALHSIKGSGKMSPGSLV